MPGILCGKGHINVIMHYHTQRRTKFVCGLEFVSLPNRRKAEPKVHVYMYGWPNNIIHTYGTVYVSHVSLQSLFWDIGSCR